MTVGFHNYSHITIHMWLCTSVKTEGRNLPWIQMACTTTSLFSEIGMIRTCMVSRVSVYDV